MSKQQIFYVAISNQFFWWFDFAGNAFCFHKTYNHIARIKPYTQSNRLLPTL